MKIGAKKPNPPSRRLSAKALWLRSQVTPTDMHPDDIENYKEGVIRGNAKAAEFANAHAKELERLIGTYPDLSAHDQLDALREEFWVSVFAETEPHP